MNLLVNDNDDDEYNKQQYVDDARNVSVSHHI